MTADQVIAALGLMPHPEGGHFRDVFRDKPDSGGRGAVTTIYYLLAAGEVSAWHRIDATEIWHHHAGDALTLSMSEDGSSVESHRLGSDVTAGERPQAVVPPGAWQSAVSAGAWTLVGCTVAPAFDFDGFELAPLGWSPG